MIAFTTVSTFIPKFSNSQHRQHLAHQSQPSQQHDVEHASRTLVTTQRRRAIQPTTCTLNNAQNQIQNKNQNKNHSNNDNDNDMNRRKFLSLVTITTATLLCNTNEAQALSKKRIIAKAGPPTTLDSGVIYRDITIGKGYSPRTGDSVAIHYSLFYKDLEVESSRESQGLAASPIGFTYGISSGPGSVMKGINVGMEGMKVGGLRLISVPPELAYGSKGKLPLIPENATVDFAVSLLSCKRAGTNPNSVIDPKAQAF